jgi:hypothetical protein
MVGVRERGSAWIAGCVVAVAAAAMLLFSPLASALRDTPGPTKINDKRGRFIPIPDRVPHVEGAYIDKRIKRNLIWLADHFRIYVTEGFAGRLPNGKKVGCPSCHVKHSEHKIGLAVDIVPLHNDWSGKCNKRWHSVTKLAKWAEPHQNEPLPPFRWVGYNGDEEHGCGNHLHLSWNHDDKYRKYKPSRWVEVFKVHRKSQKRAAAGSATASPTEPPKDALNYFESEPAAR